MERGQNYIDHREYEDLLAAAALGALTPDEHAALRAHLRTCPSCRATYAGLLTVADTLPLAVEERSPSVEARHRLQAQVEQDLRQRPPERNVPPIPPPAPVPHPAQGEEHASQRTGKVRSFRPAWLVAVAAMLLVGLIGGIAIDRFLLDDGEEDAGQTETIALQYPGDLELEDANLTYLPEQQLLHFTADNLPTPPEGNVYQVWLIEGDSPRPVGVVNQETGDFATTVDRERYGTFAITVEPGPLGSAQPTSDPIIVGQLQQNQNS